jgi:LysM repeat protein
MSKNQSRKLARTFAVASLLVVIGAGFSAVGNASENGVVINSNNSPKNIDSHFNQTQVVVTAGETIWSIARMVGGSDLNSVVDQIVAINHLSSPDVAAGSRLWVPVK